MSDVHFRNLIDPPAVDRLAGIVDPEIKARHSLVAVMQAASNEIYKRTIRRQDQQMNEMFITSATTKESVLRIAKTIGLEP